MPPIKKEKPNKSPKTSLKSENKDEAVVSGQLQKKINKKQKTQKVEKGIVFIKHLPHGFFEEQLKKYFEQFGEVSRVRLARSKRTGGSKGYAFVEFNYPEVAEVAAETMDNYLMFNKIVKACYIPPQKQHFNYFRTSVHKMKNKSGKTVWVSSKTASIQRKMKRHNDWSEDNFEKRTKRQLKKIQKLGEKYAHLGLDINKILVEPKRLTEKEKKQLEESKAKAAKEEKDAKEDKAAGSSKALKRKTENKDDQQKPKKKITLEDLLGNTIQEDSEDEDYIAVAASDEEDVDDSSDEETYDFIKDSDEEDDSENDDSDDEEIAAPIVKIKSKKVKTTFGKSLKSSNVERFDQMVKRKPHTGAIKKNNSKPLKQPSPINKNKNFLQMKAAKEIAKPLPKLGKGKLGGKGKLNKKVK